MHEVARELFGAVEFEFAFSFPDWHRDALCQEHPEAEWFPEKGQSIKPAKAICARCLAQADCLGWALDQGPSLCSGFGAAPPSANVSGSPRRER